MTNQAQRGYSCKGQTRSVRLSLYRSVRIRAPALCHSMVTPTIALHCTNAKDTLKIKRKQARPSLLVRVHRNSEAFRSKVLTKL
jgi:hypothetical protein